MNRQLWLSCQPDGVHQGRDWRMKADKINVSLDVTVVNLVGTFFRRLRLRVDQ